MHETHGHACYIDVALILLTKTTTKKSITVLSILRYYGIFCHGNHLFGTRKKYGPAASRGNFPSPWARKKEKMHVMNTCVFRTKSLCLLASPT